MVGAPSAQERTVRRFDSEAAARVDRMYQNADIVAQRRFVLDHLNLQPAEHALDIGAGPALLVCEMAEAVGPDGYVLGIDPSPDMRAIATERCRNLAQAVIADGDAVALPCDESSFHAAVATQVFEYVPDIAGALAEAHRILKPGGRLVILDTDWDSAVIRTADPARLHRILDTWRGHFVHSDLPKRLPALLHAAGFGLTAATGLPIVNTALGAETYAGGITGSIATFARKNGLPADDVDAWQTELTSLDTSGEFFFSVTRFLFTARKSA